MRSAALLLNVMVVVFFLGFLCYTFFARQHLAELARDFLTAKTVEHSRSIVALAEEALDSPIAQKLLSPDRMATIRQEIATYHNDPKRYIADLTQKPAEDFVIDKALVPLSKMAAIKQEIRTYYNGTLDVLIFDMRIFAISNLVASAIAIGLLYRTKTKVRPALIWYSLLMFIAVLYCTSLFIDNLTFFRILFRMQLSWSYPLLLGATIVALYRDFGHFGRMAEACSSNDFDREPSTAR